MEVQYIIFFLSYLLYFFWFWLSSFLPFFHLPASLLGNITIISRSYNKQAKE